MARVACSWAWYSWRYLGLIAAICFLPSLYRYASITPPSGLVAPESRYIETKLSQELQPLVDSIIGLRSSLDRVWLVSPYHLNGSAMMPSSQLAAKQLSQRTGTGTGETAKEEKARNVSSENGLSVHLWIDVPNSFPWRKCLTKYVDRIITFDCNPKDDNQQWRIIPASKSGDDVEPTTGEFDAIRIENAAGECAWPEYMAIWNYVLVVVRNCSLQTKGLWRWREDARLEWSGGGCLASQGPQKEVKMVECDESFEDQIVELGTVLPNKTIAPLQPEVWAQRQHRLRTRQLEDSKKEVSRVLEEIAELERSDQLLFPAEETHRRAVVFYVDKGSGFLSYLTWWLYAWKAIGLDAEGEEFDIILMTHPTSVGKLPRICKPLPADFDPRNVRGAGRCLYRELVGISERDHRYDDYLNSQECLVNQPAADFLQHYKLLLRADLDTFPTPRMIGYWPSDIICHRNAMTDHNLASIKNAIKAAAKDAGIEHHGWHNTDSAWFGPAVRVIALAKLTVHLSRFTRAQMFGPGTMCRCATCTRLPAECEWGGGPYAGTLLLYAQEIAINRIWTQREYDEQTGNMLDSSCTRNDTSVCSAALLHARHNSDPFSKFQFLNGRYVNYNMSNLDITNPRDYAMYMAIASHRQGLHNSRAMHNYYENVGQGIPLSQLCAKNPPYLARYAKP